MRVSFLEILQNGNFSLWKTVLYILLDVDYVHLLSLFYHCPQITLSDSAMDVFKLVRLWALAYVFGYLKT